MSPGEFIKVGKADPKLSKFAFDGHKRASSLHKFAGEMDSDPTGEDDSATDKFVKMLPKTKHADDATEQATAETNERQ
ncbi:hypothetical protein NDU88_002592 [Pleurodeles waltl]|uniref:Uncharacterized protein n=1 Tax=Pleurodeles waltl TaxID=8319 RepID=A0AAV7LCY2_PLEWA|nr:hypothetical protein NDU88_002592 [Pleurodeles waltl]